VVRTYKIGVIKGDGVGPEVINAALKVLEVIDGNFELVEIKAGYGYFKKSGKLIEDGWLDLARSLDAVIKGPLTTLPGPGTYRSINVMIRQELELYVNVRPFMSFHGISVNDLRLTIIRENTEGLYAGIEGRLKDVALTTRVITSAGSTRVAEFAFKYASRKGFSRVTAVHKANILKEGDGLFREAFFNVARRYAGITANEVFVDAAAYYMVKEPTRFEVLVTPNLYGDILSDLAAGLVGSLGLCGSAQIGEGAAVFEPVHGSAPDIAGKGVANPIGAITALSLMLEYLGVVHDESLLTAASKVRDAVKEVIEERRTLTPDLGGSASTEDVVNSIIEVISTG